MHLYICLCGNLVAKACNDIKIVLIMTTIRIASRKSPLAMQQTEFVRDQLLKLDPSLTIVIKQFQTQGDKFLSQSLSKIGGKGLFVKELENAILCDEADIAVHSMKDVPYSLPNGLEITAILKREDERDAFVSEKYNELSQLPIGATVGTSSLRRACQLKAWRSDIEIEPLRGNINTRLSKKHNFDAIILAAAGLKRMRFTDQITQLLDLAQFIPAAGQGALGIECHQDNHQLKALLKQLACPQTSQCVLAERGVILRLHGSCQVPLAAHALISSDHLDLTALVGTHDGQTLIKSHKRVPLNDVEPTQVGFIVADDLLAQGASTILEAYQ